MIVELACLHDVRWHCRDPSYLSPGLLRQDPGQAIVSNPKDDVWALGILTLEMLLVRGQRLLGPLQD